MLFFFCHDSARPLRANSHTANVGCSLEVSRRELPRQIQGVAGHMVRPVALLFPSCKEVPWNGYSSFWPDSLELIAASDFSLLHQVDCYLRPPHRLHLESQGVWFACRGRLLRLQNFSCCPSRGVRQWDLTFREVPGSAANVSWHLWSIVRCSYKTQTIPNP